MSFDADAPPGEPASCQCDWFFRCSSLESKLVQAGELGLQLVGDNETLRQENQQLLDRVKALTLSQETGDKEVASLRGSLRLSQESLTAYADRINQLETELAEVRQAGTEAAKQQRTEAAALATQLAQVERERSALEAECASLRSRAGQLEQRHTEQQTLHRDAETQISLLEGDLAAVREDRDRQVARRDLQIMEAESRLARTSQADAALIAALQEELAAVREAADVAEGLCAELDAELQTARDSLSQMADSQATAQLELLGERNGIGIVGGVQDGFSILADVDDQRRQVAEQLSELAQKHRTLAAGRARDAVKRSALRKQLATARQHAAAAAAAAEEANHNAAAAGVAAASLSAGPTNDLLVEEAAALRRELDRYVRESRVLRADNDSLRAEMAAFRRSSAAAGDIRVGGSLSPLRPARVLAPRPGPLPAEGYPATGSPAVGGTSNALDHESAAFRQLERALQAEKNRSTSARLALAAESQKVRSLMKKLSQLGGAGPLPGTPVAAVATPGTPGLMAPGTPATAGSLYRTPGLPANRSALGHRIRPDAGGPTDSPSTALRDSPSTALRGLSLAPADSPPTGGEAESPPLPADADMAGA
ncbi:hypothetical protein H696_02728 [Fonticula alba]|uniref:Uncharacterized protein n=1 Tax=Fonticula alba TaxID=691883 RepID=A0A058ZA34_FONAL|nr:hypothetical protein H696_02728 [Fonticula alba]KCV70392.1 hypothetical protein H696_02728 [Fonticula alba]|eukprot:XP_009494908.1 hypothetical protein H696_02728 [Fonticula alba]